MSRIERLLRRLLPKKELGWTEIGEQFTRYTILRTKYLTVYLHQLSAPNPAPECHDHPWHFWAFILLGGYWETLNGGPTTWHGPWSILYRHATDTHNVTTPLGRTNWSLIVASRKTRRWSFKTCPTQELPPVEKTGT